MGSWTQRIRYWNDRVTVCDGQCARNPGSPGPNLQEVARCLPGANGDGVNALLNGDQSFHLGRCPWPDPGTNLTPNCDGTFSASYTCGRTAKELSVSNDGMTWDKVMPFDCSQEVALANSTHLDLADDGTLKLVNDKLGKTLWTWKPKSRLAATPTRGWVRCGKYVGSMPTGGYLDKAGTRGSWLSSPNGHCRLIPHREEGTKTVHHAATEHSAQSDTTESSGLYKYYLRLEWHQGNCGSATDSSVPIAGRAGGDPGTDAVALYEVPQLPPTVWSSATRGSYITGSKRGCAGGSTPGGERKSFGEGAYELGTTYTKIAGYDNPGHDIPNAYAKNVSKRQCEEICNQYGGKQEEGQPNRSGLCAGFVYNTATKECYPKDSGMFPKGLRVPADSLPGKPPVDLHLRKFVPATGDTCPKTVKTTTAYQIQSFPESGEVDTSMSCDLASATECDYQPVEEAAADLRAKRDSMLAKIKELSKTDSRLVAELGYNVDRLTNDIYDYDQIVNKSSSLSGGGAMVVPKALQEDTDLRMLTENYRYLLWTIAAAVAVGVGVKMGSK